MLGLASRGAGRDVKILELFGCSGGLAEGFRRAGMAPSVAFDHDEDACDSYEANHGHRPIRMDVRDLLRMAAAGALSRTWDDGPIDLIIADPPCAPWSRAGKRLGQDDERDLLAVTVELVRLLRPRFWLIANVPGLDDGPNWPVVQRVIGGLAREGYCIDFRRLDAANYGVPQHRVRPFWYGHALEAPCIAWPAPTHCDPAELRTIALRGMEPLAPWVTCRQALQHLAPEDLGKPVRLRLRGCSSAQHGSVPERPARVVGTSNLSDGNILLFGDVVPRVGRSPRPPSKKPRASMADQPAGVVTSRENQGDGSVLVFDGPNHRPSRADAPARTLTRNTHSDGAPLVPSFTVTTKGDGRGAQGACALEWPWGRPSTTVTTREAVPPPGHHPESGSILSMPGAVKLSEKAAAILQGFPESWKFCGKTKAARWSQIGMAMPPPLGEAVARSIARATRVHGEEAAE